MRDDLFPLSANPLPLPTNQPTNKHTNLKRKSHPCLRREGGKALSFYPTQLLFTFQVIGQVLVVKLYQLVSSVISKWP